MDTTAIVFDGERLPRVPIEIGNRKAVDFIFREDLDLDPPCQRGSVWGADRQRNLWFSLLSGIPSGLIIVSRRADSTSAVIDGKQRVEALRAFHNGTLTLPAGWFGASGADAGTLVTIDELDEIGPNQAARATVSVGTVDDLTLDGEQHLFDLVNFGGVPQGASDLQ